MSASRGQMSRAGRALAVSERAVVASLVRLGVDPEKARTIARGQCAPLKVGRGPTRGPRQQPEHDEQVALFAWADLQTAYHPELRWLFAVPNWIGTHTLKHGAYLKAEGRKPGVPDVWLPIPRGRFHGCVIEMKVKPNRPSDEQRRWLAMLETVGYSVHVCYSAGEASDALLAYLALPAPPAVALPPAA